MGDWWTRAERGGVARGRLLWAVVPHVHQHPFVLIPKGRTEETEHGRADYEVIPLTTTTAARAPMLPVAGMPDIPDELKMVLRAKRRPVVVLGNAGMEVERSLTIGDARFHTNTTLLVAPYYSANKWKPELIERIRRCAYPQFLWDTLPLPGYRDSVLRLDHIQPIGNHGESYSLTDHCLTGSALAIIEEQMAWLRTGSMAEGSILPEIRHTLLGSS